MAWREGDKILHSRWSTVVSRPVVLTSTKDTGGQELSLGLIIVRFAIRYRRIADFPSGGEIPLGTQAELRAVFDAAFPGVEWYSGHKGFWSGGDPSLDFWLAGDPVTSAHLTLRGISAGKRDEVLAVLLNLRREDGWHVIEDVGSELLDASLSLN